MSKFPTRCVHAGTIEDHEKKGVNSPVYVSTSYAFIDRPETVYPRYLNTPNEKAVADKIAALEETEAALVFSSGMAAISTSLLAFLSQGDHAVFQKGLYGGTSHFLISEFNRFGLQFSVAESQSAEDIEAALKPGTKVIYIETPSNPLLNITDIAAVAQLAKKRGIITMIDNTFATPVNQQPYNLGIDIVIHSATKYMGGHSDICAGAVASRKEIIEKVHATGLNFGGSLNALTLHLLERSLKTLEVRVSRINQNALQIASHLEKYRRIKKVNYPGLVSHPDHDLAKKQMNGFGGMLSFEVEGIDSLAYQKKLKLISPSMSLGGLETIVSSPAHTSHRHLGPEGRKKEGIPEELIRMSVGIEDPQDIIADLEGAFE